MWRNIGGTVAGLLVGMVVVGVVELIGMWIVQPPAEVQAAMKSNDPAKLRAVIDKLPLASFLFVLSAWTAGAFAGPFTTALVCKQLRVLCAASVGFLLWLMTFAMLLMIPGPVFMWSGLLLVPIACAAAIALAVSMIPRPEGPRPYDMREKGMACK